MHAPGRLVRRRLRVPLRWLPLRRGVVAGARAALASHRPNVVVLRVGRRHPALGNAAYTNAALDTTTTLLTWSGSDYGNGEPSTCDLCGGACACSSEIPTTLVSLWFTTLTYRRC